MNHTTLTTSNIRYTGKFRYTVEREGGTSARNDIDYRTDDRDRAFARRAKLGTGWVVVDRHADKPASPKSREYRCNECSRWDTDPDIRTFGFHYRCNPAKADEMYHDAKSKGVNIYEAMAY